MIARPHRLVLLGSVIADLLIRVPALPERGGDVVGAADPIQAGGGFNVLAAASRLGMPTALLGLVGQGPLGTVLAAALAETGTELLLPRAAGDTGLCVVLVEPDGERTFVTTTGVEAGLTADLLDDVRPAAGDVVYVSGYDLAYAGSGPVLADWIGRVAPRVVFDPGPLVTDIPPRLLDTVLAHTGILTLNARELALLSGGADPEVALTAVTTRVPTAAVIARAGADGCRVAVAGRSQQVPAPRVTPVDTTGAGDAHTGALLAALSAGHDLLEAARRANAAAAYAVTRAGSATAPGPDELASMLPGLSGPTG